MTWTPTPEQQRACELFATDADLVIEAGAGAAKTSTLMLMADGTPRRGTYLAFNKSLATEAAAKFGGNVACSTVHSLAYRSVGRQFGDRLRTSQRIRAFEAARLLGLDPMVVTTPFGRKPLAAGYLAGLANRAVKRFCMTADEVPGERHVPYIEGIDMPTDDGRRTYSNNRIVAAAVAEVLPTMWEDLSHPHGRYQFTHDCYLKLWALSRPVIPGDFVLVDEAQDLNGVMTGVLNHQDAQRVVVGDRNQQLYEWRGSIDALDRFDFPARAVLSRSFRFGPPVAEVANIILGWLQAELRLTGSDNVSSVIGPVADPDAILCRTNALAVGTVMRLQKSGRRPHLVGGGQEIIAFAKAARDLMSGRKTYHPDLSIFDTWGEVTDYVSNDAEGGDLKMLVDLVQEYGVDAILAALERMPSEAAADVVVSTGHRAKGREWSSVQLAADFGGKPEDGLPGPEELRLLYVAATRAKHELDVSAVALLNPKVEA